MRLTVNYLDNFVGEPLAHASAGAADIDLPAAAGTHQILRRGALPVRNRVAPVGLAWTRLGARRTESRRRTWQDWG